MKLSNNIPSNIKTAPSSGQLCYVYGNGTAVPVNQTTRVGTRYRTQPIKKNRRRNKNTGSIEINKAEGGYKDITIPFKQLGVGINLYGRLLAIKIGNNWYYRIGMETNNYAGEPYIDIKNYLNSSEEFIKKLAVGSQYKILGVNTCIKYTRAPHGGDMLPTLYLYMNTKKVEVQDPKTEQNIMRLNMNLVGTKNYNVRLNSANMEKENVQWISCRELYEGNIRLHVDQEDIVVLNEAMETETTVILGQIKITISMLLRYTDVTTFVQPTKKVDPISELIKDIKEIKMNLADRS